MFRRPARVMKDFMEVMNNVTGFISVIADNNPSMKTFHVEINGPSETPFVTGKFVVLVNVPPDFPMDPPKMRMITPVWHPNISVAGKICVDILDEEWCPGITLLEALEGIRGLLANPNPDSPSTWRLAPCLEITEQCMMQWELRTQALLPMVCSAYISNGTITDADVEEKISVLTALGMSRGEALKRLAMTRCDTQRVIDLFSNEF